jgi:hypothetical protein
MSSTAANTIGPLTIAVGVQVKVYRVVLVSLLVSTPPSTSPLVIEKVAKFESSTMMSKEDSWFKTTMKETGPVITGGLFAAWYKNKTHHMYCG